MSGPRNHELKDKLFILGKAFSPIAAKGGLDIKDIGLDNARFRFGCHSNVSPLFAGLLASIEGIEALQIINSDTIIKKHIDKLIGSPESQIRISGAGFLQAFLKWHFCLNESCDETLFAQCYKSFEGFFSESDLVSIESCRLFNFECDVDVSEIQLSSDVKIRKANQHECLQSEKEFNDTFRWGHYAIFSRSNYVVEKRTKVRKIVCDENQIRESVTNQQKLELAEYRNNIESTNAAFDCMVKLLRLLKPSSVYRDHQVKHQYDGYFGSFSSSTTRSQHLENTVVGEKCVLNHDDIKDLKEFWSFLEKEKNNKVLEIALDRLSYATERRTIADRMLDNFIGLESLYLPDGNQELTFRLSLRVAMMTEDTRDKAQDTFLLLKKMYDVRSKIAHGKKIKIEQGELDSLEELLRNSIKLFMQDKSKFNEDGLNTIFFKMSPF